MLKKIHRLTTGDFDLFFKKGRRYHSSMFTCIYSQHPTLHISVVVPKKVEKTAVGRNRLRRQIYDVLRRHNNLPTGVYIVIMKSTPSKPLYSKLKESIIEMIGRVANK